MALQYGFGAQGEPRRLCNGDKSSRHLRSIRYDHRNRIALLNADRPQCATGPLSQTEQIGPGHRLPIRCADSSQCEISAAEQAWNCANCDHNKSALNSSG